MLYRVDEDVFRDFPEFMRGVVVADQVDNHTYIPELERLLQAKSEQIRVDDLVTVNHPRIQIWYDAYRRFGADVKDTPPSIATLVKRIKQGKSISFISPIVAIMNLVSLSYLMPSGGIDATRVKGDLILGRSKGDEKYVPLGRDEHASLQLGEVIYFDSALKNVICRSWNSRAGKATIISADTSSVIIDVDCMLSVVPNVEIHAATSHLAELIGRYCGREARTKFRFLTRDNPELSI